MLVDGELIGSDSGKTFDNVNPATEEVLGPVADASNAEMHRAIDAARRAFDDTDWSTNRERRKECLTQLQEALEKEQEDLREELILEVGCPRMTTHANQLDIPLDAALRYPIKLMDEFAWRTDLPTAVDRRGNVNTRQVWKEPVGVVGAIVPWNFPLEVTLNKLGQALATGNTVVLKPAPDTPWNATRLGRLVAEQTDFPRGVLNVVTSSDHLVGEELTLSPEVDLISFTGSTAVGKRIMEKGAATLKRVFLELGGKSATIVLDDADFATTVPSGAQVCFHAGQGCAIQTRMLLPRSRYEEGVEILKATLSSVAYGDPQRPDVIMGPLVSAKQRERVLGYIEKGVQGGRDTRPGRGPAVPPGPGMVRGADALHRRRQLHDHRPAGDLRTGAGRDPLRGRRRRRAHRQRQCLRALGRCLLGLARALAGGGGAHPHRDVRSQRGHGARAGRHPLRWLQAQRDRPAERDGRVRPVPRDQVGGLADAAVGHRARLVGAAMTDHTSALREHGYHQLRVKAVVAETADANSFVLDVPAELAGTFRYRPGQFCTFRVQVDGDEQLRSYSMSSAPETDDDLTVTVKRVAGGLVSNWFLDHLAEGSVVEATKPAGVFCPQDSERAVLGFCGGSGVTPVMSITKHVLATTRRPVRLLYANRDHDSVIFDRALATLGERHGDRLEVHHHLDADGGFLTADDVAAFVRDAGGGDADCYICGPGPFMDLVESTLLGLGVAPEHIYIERFLVEQQEKDTAATATGAIDAEPASGATDAAPSEVTVILNGKKTVVTYQPGDTLLETARRGGLRPPFSCEAGNCATCMAFLKEGSARMRANNTLTPEEVEEGWILTCQGLPQGPVVTVEYESM